jgi:hypothetical protein
MTVIRYQADTKARPPDVLGMENEETRCAHHGCDTPIPPVRLDRGGLYCCDLHARRAKAARLTVRRRQDRAKHPISKRNNSSREAVREQNRRWPSLQRLAAQVAAEEEAQRKAQAHLGKLMPEVSAKIAHIETVTHALHQRAEQLEEEIDAHIAAAQALAQILVRLATKHHDPLLLMPNIAKLVGNYLPHRPPNPNHRNNGA